MEQNYLSDLHFQYMDVIQHWHKESQSQAGGDALLTFLQNGWQPLDTVLLEEHWFAGMRLVVVYHFELRLNGEILRMPVINNPYVTRLIWETNLRIRAKDGHEQETLHQSE